MLTIVNVAAIDFQNAAQQGRIVFRIPYKRDVSEIIFTTFFYCNFNVDEFVVYTIVRIANDTCIAVTHAVVFRY